MLKKQYSRLKKAIEKIISPKRQQRLPQLILQPVRNLPQGRPIKKYEG
ncbi:MAG: hypothetical protein SGI96_17685 [Bacteroidota bacterium]|nr:hypothetical protein [Chitinophagaceae bacterium]MDZ4810071.1 hypothetical protein [Bacteroidota bacterium]